MVSSAVLVLRAQCFAREPKRCDYVMEVLGFSDCLYNGSASSGFDF